MKKTEYILLCILIGVFAFFLYAVTTHTHTMAMAAEGEPIAVIYTEAYQADKSGTVEVRIAPGEDNCPINDTVKLPEEVQMYIWDKCREATEDYRRYYAFILGVIQLESSFNRKAVGHNDNGTTDRGLMQINSKNISKMKKNGLITCTEDLFDIFKNIDCGFFMMNRYIDKYGVSEDAYYAYNTGKTHGGSNANSRIVMKYAGEWEKILYK